MDTVGPTASRLVLATAASPALVASLAIKKKLTAEISWVAELGTKVGMRDGVG